jgi:hypothetical protein
MRRLALCAVTLLCACHDAGDDALAKVKTQYAALLQVGTPAQSRDFDALLKELDAIPKSSRARGEADKLKRAIEAARGSSIERPLAVAATPLPDLGAPRVQVQLEATRAECERLAKDVSGTEGEQRKQKLELLDACRRRADELVDALEHDHAADGGHE